MRGKKRGGEKLGEVLSCSAPWFCSLTDDDCLYGVVHNYSSPAVYLKSIRGEEMSGSAHSGSHTTENVWLCVCE